MGAMGAMGAMGPMGPMWPMGAMGAMGAMCAMWLYRVAIVLLYGRFRVAREGRYRVAIGSL